MKTTQFTIPQAILGPVTSVCGLIGTKRTALPILANVLIAERDDRLSFTVSDLDVSIECQVAVKVPRGTRFTISVKDFIAMSGDGDGLSVEISDGACHLGCGRVRGVIPTLPVDDFPPVQVIDKKAEKAPFPASKLRETLLAAGRFASTNPARYMLNSVLLDFRKDGTFAVATDGRQLAQITIQGGSAEPRQIVIPTDTAAIIAKLCDNADGDALVRADERAMTCQLEVEGADVLLTSKLLEGKYPNYNQVFPDSSQAVKTTVKREEFLAAICSIGFACDDLGGLDPRVRMSIDGETVTLKTSMNGIAKSAEVTVECSKVKKPIDATFNYQGLKASFSSCSDGSLELGYFDEMSVIIIQALDAVFLQMPFRNS